MGRAVIDAGATVEGGELEQQAGRLLDVWSALSTRHVALGAACACGMGGISLRLEDFELDIVGYLEDAGLRADVAEVVVYFAERQSADGQEHPLRRMLEDARHARLPRLVVEWLLPKVDRTLRSFAELHGPRLES
jgi:hypothetical protein